jgi:hypothetical protein
MQKQTKPYEDKGLIREEERKIIQNVNFNDTIDIRKYVDGDSYWMKVSVYQLYGVAYHQGSIDFEH